MRRVKKTQLLSQTRPSCPCAAGELPNNTPVVVPIQSRLRNLPMLKMVLQDFRSYGWMHRGLLGLRSADNLSAANHFGGRQSGDLCGQHQVDLELHVGWNQFFRAE